MTNIFTKKYVNLQSPKYRILGLVGQGQFGQVFCAIDKQSKQLVALKFLDSQRFPTNKFLRELRFLTTLQHPNIVSCQAVEYASKGRYLVMDYCEGGTLRDVIDSQKLNFASSLQLIADILLGLSYCHSHGIIHCDLKPENILLNISKKGWIPRISDFGISRVVKETSYTYSTYIGSPAYMAPERFYGEYSMASDIYAVGVLLFELIVGERPFSGLYKELTKAHLSQPVEVPIHVPFLIRCIILRALQKLPQHRFTSALEMLNCIELALEVEEATLSDDVLFTPPIMKSVTVDYKTISLSQKSDYLVVDNNRIYQVSGSKVGTQEDSQLLLYRINNSFTQISPQDKINLPAPITKIHITNNSCFIVIKSEQNYAIYHLSKNKIQPQINDLSVILSCQAFEMITTVNSEDQWIAIAKISSQESNNSINTLQILQLPQERLINVTLNFSLPAHLFTLDSSHGLITFTEFEKTIFQIFTRRGNLLHRDYLPLVLESITQSLSNPYQFLAVEKNKTQGLIIDLQSFSIMRIVLGINPNFAIATSWGFALGTEQGKIVLLNQNGRIIGNHEFSKTITTITVWREYSLLIGMKNSSNEIYYQLVNLDNLSINNEDEDI